MTSRVRFPKTAVADALKKLDADPFLELVALARRTEVDGIAARIWLELAQYVAPKLKAFEISGPDRGPIQMEFNLRWPD